MSIYDIPDCPAVRDAMRFGTDDGYAKVVYTCDICGEDIYEGESCYEIGDMIICRSCIEDAHKIAELDD